LAETTIHPIHLYLSISITDVIKRAIEIVLAHTYIILRYATVSIRWILEVEAGYPETTCLLLAVLFKFLPASAARNPVSAAKPVHIRVWGITSNY
jgi:hypothetical protein